MKYLSQDAGDGGGRDAEAGLEEAEYFQRIEEHFGQRRGGPLVLSPKEWLLVQRWREKGIPLPIVLRGINMAFDRFAASGPRPDRLNTLSYCAQHVETAWEEHRRAHAGSTEATTRKSIDMPSPAVLHLRAVATSCRRAVSPSLPDVASTALESAAQELDALAERTASGEVDAASLDGAAKLLEQQLEDALAGAWHDSGGETPERLADLQIPRFSPYAV
jgi:hypothetical protein